jgi:hypothetical protein
MQWIVDLLSGADVEGLSSRDETGAETRYGVDDHSVRSLSHDNVYLV